jgi:hypothetical protein
MAILPIDGFASGYAKLLGAPDLRSRSLRNENAAADRFQASLDVRPVSA